MNKVITSATDVLQPFYSRYYHRYRHDSPDDSRKNMAASLVNILESSGERLTILDIGSGMQAIEKSLRVTGNSSGRKLLKQRLGEVTMISGDLVQTKRNRLLNRDYTPHIQLDARALPFQDESIDVVFSNHSIDMLRRTPSDYQSVLREVSRVTKQDGQFLFNFHHADLFDDLSEQGIVFPAIAAFYDGVAEHNPYYRSEYEISSELVEHGLICDQIKLASDISDQWWEVKGHKAA